jgi:hypothetical protein
VSQAVSITQLQNIGKKPANQSPPKKHPQRVTSSEELVNLLSSEKIKVVRTLNILLPAMIVTSVVRW